MQRETLTLLGTKTVLWSLGSVKTALWSSLHVYNYKIQKSFMFREQIGEPR